MEAHADSSSSLQAINPNDPRDIPDTTNQPESTPQLFDSSLFDQPSQKSAVVDDFMSGISQGNVPQLEDVLVDLESDDKGIDHVSLDLITEKPPEKDLVEVSSAEGDQSSNDTASLLQEQIGKEDTNIIVGDSVAAEGEAKAGKDLVGVSSNESNQNPINTAALIQEQTRMEDINIIAGDSVVAEGAGKDLVGVSSNESDQNLINTAALIQEQTGMEDINIIVGDSVAAEGEARVGKDLVGVSSNESDQNPINTAALIQEQTGMEDTNIIEGEGVAADGRTRAVEDKPSQEEAMQSVQLIQVETPVQTVEGLEGSKFPESVPHGILKQSSTVPHQSKRISWGDDDPFLSAITNSEADRRQDAWLPCESTARVLQARAATQGTDYTSRPDLTMPGISFDEVQMDPLKELLYKYQGEEEAKKRNKLTLDQVTRDLDGLKRLLNDGCHRSALQLTSLLLTSVGQGKGQAGMPSQNTAESLQIWFTRLALLAKLRQFSTADIESKPFNDVDKPDMYYQYYPALYPGRKGSMAPFSFRVLLAELPQYVSQHQESMTRLYALLATSEKIVSNLHSGLDEYGVKSGVSEKYIEASLILWKGRVNRIQHSIGNCLLVMKDYYQSIKVFERLSRSDAVAQAKIQSLIGRVYLQLGDLKSAQEIYTLVEKATKAEDKAGSIQVLMNRGFLRMAQNMYTDAHIQFSEVVKLDPGHFTAINNISVCLLYMGKLKSALTLLESLINGDPEKYLDESILFNLCTLYELESSRSSAKKQNLLSTAAKYRGDGFNDFTFFCNLEEYESDQRSLVLPAYR